MSLDLRNTLKGQLRYDRNWHKDGKLPTILNEIASNDRFVSLHPSCLPSKTASFSTSHDGEIVGKDDGTSTSNALEARHNKKRLKQTFSVVEDPEDASESESGIEDDNWDIVDCFNALSVVELQPQALKIELEIGEYKQQQWLQITEFVDDKREVFDQFLKNVYRRSLHDLKLHQTRRRLLEEIRLKDLEAKMEEGLGEIERYQQKLKNDHESFAKLSDERLKEASLKDKHEEDMAQKRVELRQRFAVLAGCKQQISNTYQEIVAVVKTCKNLLLVPPDVRVAVQCMNEVVTDVQKIIDRVRSGRVEDVDVETMKQLEEKTESCLKIITLGIDFANKAAEDEAEKLLNDAKSDALVGKSNTQLVEGNTECRVNAASSRTTLPSNSANFKRYFDAMETLNRTIDSCKDLSSNTMLKSYRFNLKKAINTPVNAISSQSGSHLRDKLYRLSKILSGHQVDVSDHRVSANEHPLGKTFCMDLLAKKFVNQGEEQVSSSLEAAFPIAMVIVGLWKEHPPFGDLLLAHFYLKCPYLVPYHVCRTEDQNDDDYYSGLGYNIVDGVLEQKDKFLKRMSGIVRLYAAIVQSPLPGGQHPPHPHGVQFAWRWLACTLNLEPIGDVTATVLYEFLAVCGYHMQRAYGQQFDKIVYSLCHDYFPKIKAATSAESGGPITRLETFLQNYVRDRNFPRPDGLLPPNFWLT